MAKYLKIDDKIIDSKDPMAIIKPVWLSVDIYSSKEEYERGLESFSFHQRSIFAIMWFISEVFNGGFYQFYTNSTGIVWEDAMDGFELIGIPEAQKIIKESSERFNPQPSFDRIKREDYLVATDIEFEDLDNRIYSLDEQINLTEKIADYIYNDRMPFYFEGEVEE